MKVKIYTRFLSTTSFVLNICVRNSWWILASKLIAFRKKHVAAPLRKGLCIK